jgi:uncharacterized protein involved in exopolysaccharide biosynthesis
MSEQRVEYYQDDEMTLREVILKVREYYRELLSKRKIVALLVLAGMSIQAHRVFTFIPYYPASLSFMVNESKGSSIGGMLGQLGSLVGVEKEERHEKILELAKSRRMMARALFDKHTLDGRDDYFANHIIHTEKFHKAWRRDTVLNGFLFTRGDPTQFNNIENRVLKAIHMKLAGGEQEKEPLYAAKAEKKTGIMTLTIKTRKAELSIALANALFKSLSDYYIESTVRKEQETYNLLTEKKDSLEHIIYANDIQTARHADQSYSLLSAVDKVPAKRFDRNNIILTTLYAEVLKNWQLAEFALKTSTPFITSIDEPILPIKPTRKSLLKSLIVGAVIGGMLSVTYILGMYIYRQAMAEGAQ